MSNKLKVGYGVIASLAAPLVVQKDAPKLTKTDLARWIGDAIGPCFNESNQDGLDYRYAVHRWEDYVRGPFDDFFWSLEDLVGEEAFSKMAAALSSDPNGTRIPENSGHRKDGNTYSNEPGLSFFGLTRWSEAQAHTTNSEKGAYASLEARHCLRGIGPNGELILRLRKIGGMELKVNAHSDGFPFPEVTEEDAWKRRVEGNLLDTVGKKKSLQQEICIDCCICFPYAIAASLASALDSVHAARAIVESFIRSTSPDGDEGESKADCPVFSTFERNILFTAPWSNDPIEAAKDIAGILARYELAPDNVSLFDAALAHFDRRTEGALTFAVKRQPKYLDNIARWRNEIQERNPQFRWQDQNSRTFNDGFVRPSFGGIDPAEWLLQPLNGERCSHGILIQANSGMGKTTFVRGLAAACAKARLDESFGEVEDTAEDEHGGIDGDAERFLAMILAASQSSLPEAKKALSSFIPIMIVQPVDTDHYAEQYSVLVTNPELSFADFLYSLQPHAINSAFSTAYADTDDEKRSLFESILKTKEVLLLVDSIDEVPKDYRLAYIEKLETFVRDYGIKRFIVTSRPLPTTHNGRLLQLTGNCKATLLPFDECQQEQLFEKLLPYGAFGNDPDDTEKKNLFGRIAATRGLAQMMGNPLILTTIARNVLAATANDIATIFDEIDRDLPKFRELDDYDKLVLWRLAHDMTVDAQGHRLSYNNFIEQFTRYRIEAQQQNRGSAERFGGGFESVQDAQPQPTETDVIDRTIMRRGILVLRDNGYIEFEYPAIKAHLASKWIINSFERSIGTKDPDRLFDQPLELVKKLIGAYAESLSPGKPDNDAALIATLFVLNHRHFALGEEYDRFRELLYKELFETCLFSDSRTDKNEQLRKAAESIVRETEAFQLGMPIEKPECAVEWQGRLCAFSRPQP